MVPSITATATEAQVICVSAPKRWKPLVVWTVGEIEMRLRGLVIVSVWPSGVAFLIVNLPASRRRPGGSASGL
jgi:hypothetical protein